MSLRIKFVDIETGYNLVRVHSLHQYKSGVIPASAIEQERYIICATFQDVGSKSLRSYSVLDTADKFDKDPSYDRGVVADIYKEIAECDAIIGHNSDKFDLRRIAARGAFWHLGPMKPVIQIDTLKIARKHFDFNSNRLDYLGEYLGVGRKLRVHGDLWEQALHGDEKAVGKMVRYNRQDVRLLAAVWGVLAPWAPAKLNKAIAQADSEPSLVCPSCGSPKTQRRGVSTSKTRVYTRYQCQSCGHWYRSVLAEPNKALVTSG